MIDETELRTALAGYIPQQRWFGNRDRTLTRVADVEVEVLRDGEPALVWVTATVEFDRGSPVRYHVPLGVTTGAPATIRDVTGDPDLARALLSVVAPGESARAMRPMSGEQSNTSLVYDERLILKLYRRPPDGPNPDAEVTDALAGAGFPHVAPVVARWSKAGVDRAIVQPFLADGEDGWALAVASVAAGDFSHEARRLGQVTAQLHVALAPIFGTAASDPRAWGDAVTRQLERTNDARIDEVAVAAAIENLGGLDDAGMAIRVHGDYHLGQTLRTPERWYILDFEGEPARPLAERRATSSPLKDVAGMLRSFNYASRVGGATELTWEARARDAFLASYRDAVAGHGLVPADAAAFTALLTVFELDKAIYEVAYEAAHRPDWIDIPLDAVNRLVAV